MNSEPEDTTGDSRNSSRFRSTAVRTIHAILIFGALVLIEAGCMKSPIAAEKRPQSENIESAPVKPVVKTGPSDPQEGLAVGDRFPDFQDYDVELKPVSPSTFRGRVVLVEFWASASGPCMAELPKLRALYDKYHLHGLEMIGVSLDPDREQFLRYLRYRPIPWAQYCDGMSWDGKLAARYEIRSIPESFLLDRNGRILARGPRSDGLDRAIAAVLGEP